MPGEVAGQTAAPSAGWYRSTGKRSLDIVLALVTAPIWVTLCALIATVLKVTCGSPVFFSHSRAGFKGRPFTLFKFRTMSDRRDARGALLPSSERVTNVGRILRSLSVDELPQLWNVLRGDLSLVGPRPLLPEYLPLYSDHQARRHDVRPGLTGWAQIHGRNAVSWEEKFDLDVSYVDRLSFALDLEILFRTALMLVRRPAGAFHVPSRFTGSPTSTSESLRQVSQ